MVETFAGGVLSASIVEKFPTATLPLVSEKKDIASPELPGSPFSPVHPVAPVIPVGPVFPVHPVLPV